jgi:hypothetical protein
LIKDRYFNRVASVLSKCELLIYTTHMPLQEDIITMRSWHNKKVLAVLLMDDLAIVKVDYLRL